MYVCGQQQPHVWYHIVRILSARTVVLRLITSQGLLATLKKRFPKTCKAQQRSDSSIRNDKQASPNLQEVSTHYNAIPTANNSQIRSDLVYLLLYCTLPVILSLGAPLKTAASYTLV